MFYFGLFRSSSLSQSQLEINDIEDWWISVVPDIIQFWKDVVHYREVGNEEVQKRIDGRKRGPKKKVFTIQLLNVVMKKEY